MFKWNYGRLLEFLVRTLLLVVVGYAAYGLTRDGVALHNGTLDVASYAGWLGVWFGMMLFFIWAALLALIYTFFITIKTWRYYDKHLADKLALCGQLYKDKDE